MCLLMFADVCCLIYCLLFRSVGLHPMNSAYFGISYSSGPCRPTDQKHQHLLSRCGVGWCSGTISNHRHTVYSIYYVMYMF